MVSRVAAFIFQLDTFVLVALFLGAIVLFVTNCAWGASSFFGYNGPGSINSWFGTHDTTSIWDESAFQLCYGTWRLKYLLRLLGLQPNRAIWSSSTHVRRTNVCHVISNRLLHGGLHLSVTLCLSHLCLFFQFLGKLIWVFLPFDRTRTILILSLIHISEPTRPY